MKIFLALDLAMLCVTTVVPVVLVFVAPDARISKSYFKNFSAALRRIDVSYWA